MNNNFGKGMNLAACSSETKTMDYQKVLHVLFSVSTK